MVKKQVSNSISLFHSEIESWFLESIGIPTAVQETAWPVIASGKHSLITAPTGTGKTLTAFLWGLNQLITGKWQGTQPQLLYISPLKALNNDIQRNLISPLMGLKEQFEKKDLAFPEIRVLTRSGDTPQSERRLMLRQPPDILITTPESLNLLLSSKGGRGLLTDIKTVILDEIHAVIENQRGTMLASSIERLTLLSGEFQRIALSATVKPLDLVAKFVAGYELKGDLLAPTYQPRSIEIVTVDHKKTYDVEVCFPSHGTDPEFKESFWKPMVHDFRDIIDQNNSTLLFTNSRRLSEIITLKINAEENEPVAYAHHGSLSREIRFDVEQRLKAGELKAIVATQSLELGIDVGALDEVVLIQSPNSVASAVQRIGRAGHGVGQTSKARFFPTHDHDFLTSAVLAKAVLDGDIESVHPIENPLDVLAQIIISMTGVEVWSIDVLYSVIKTCWSYHTLPRSLFDLVINMLAGRYQKTRIRELTPRVLIDSDKNTIQAKKGALLSLYTSGGTIPDRGYFHLRHQQTGSQIGELDEEFVWEARKGQVFSLGTQNWKIQNITHNDVIVTPASSSQMAAPFWIGEEFHRESHFSERVSEFLEWADTELDSSEFKEILQQDYAMGPQAADQVVHYLKRQKSKTQCALPHRHHLLIEYVQTGPGGVPGNQIVLHTFWGGRVNKPFSLALEVAWKNAFGYAIDIYPGNDAIIIVIPEKTTGQDIMSLVTPENLDRLLRTGLEGSGFFGARFRESAGRALLVTRHKFNQRMPLWMTRLRSQKLMESVLEYEDFPILLEAWRVCLQDAFDMDKLRLALEEIENGAIKISTTETQTPSPMAQEISWRQINQYMYAGDELKSGQKSQLKSDLIREVAQNQNLRPQIAASVIQKFEEKRQRLYPGYSPSSTLDCIDWVDERVFFPEAEWDLLNEAMNRDYGLESEEWIAKASEKMVRFKSDTMDQWCIATKNRMTRIVSVLFSDQQLDVKDLSSGLVVEAPGNSLEEEESILSATSLLMEWMRFYGPKSRQDLLNQLGFNLSQLNIFIDDCLDTESWIEGALVQNSEEDYLCDLENYESLLRLSRSLARPEFQALPLEKLPLLLAMQQGLVYSKPSDSKKLTETLDQLSCYSAVADLWESQFLPARLMQYRASDLDSLIQEGEIQWQGTGEKRIAFTSHHSSDLFEPLDNSETTEQPVNPFVDAVFKDELARYDFSALLQISDLSPTRLAETLWQLVWAGQLQNDSFIALRRGLLQKFKIPAIKQSESRFRGSSGRSTGRSRFHQWKQSMPYAGNWYRTLQPEIDASPLNREEINKDRVRLLLDRYGILFREILMRETSAFQWKYLFRSLRLMELSGEVISGYFFEGIPGPQFMSLHSFQLINHDLPEHSIYWMNANDPASCCGLGLEGLKRKLPSRVEGTHLVYRGSELIIISQRSGKKLEINLLPDDSDLPKTLAFIQVMLHRDFNPLSRVVIETINGEDAGKSLYVPVFKSNFECSVDFKTITLYRSI